MSVSRENKLSLFKYWDDNVHMFHHVSKSIEPIQDIMKEALKLKEKLELEIEESKAEKEEDAKYENLMFYINNINDRLKKLYLTSFRWRNEKSVSEEIKNIEYYVDYLKQNFPELKKYYEKNKDILKENVIRALITEKNRLQEKYNLLDGEHKKSSIQNIANNRVNEIDQTILNIKSESSPFYRSKIIYHLEKLQEESTFSTGSRLGLFGRLLNAIGLIKSDGYNNIQKIIEAVEDHNDKSLEPIKKEMVKLNK